MTPHDHAHDAHAWAERFERYDRIADALEPEMSKVSALLLDAARVAPTTRLLDLACGPGHTAAAGSTRGAIVTGLDANPRAVASATRRFPQTRFIVGDMIAPPPGPWDAITCRLGAHHADTKWLRAARDVLVPGGRLAIAEFDASTEHARERGMLDPTEWTRLLEQAGYEDIHVETCPLDIASLIARDPPLARERDDPHGCHLHDGPIYIIRGTKPATGAR